MDPIEFGKLVVEMKAVYADPKFLPDGNALDIWYMLLQDIPYDDARRAAERHMMTSRFPPTIADIREGALPKEEASELEAWALVYRAVCNSTYHAEEEFERLPALCRAAVGSPDNLREMAKMDEATVGSVEQSHFIRAYRAAAGRERDLAKLPQHVREQLRRITAEAGKEEKA